MMSYSEKLRQALQATDSCLCVGLDPDIRRISGLLNKRYVSPSDMVLSFLKEVVDATKDSCCAYKPNLGFFEALGRDGLDVFADVVEYIPDSHIVIADAKRGDISSTAEHYAKAYFDVFDVDAVTVNPLMGFESLDPFLNYSGKAVYCLTLTSNSGASDFLMKSLNGYGNDMMAVTIARRLSEIQQQKNTNTHLGMVVGATQANGLEQVIANHPGASLLIPGIGTQGGSVDELGKVLGRHEGIPVINASRSILYAGEQSDQKNWLQAVERKAAELKQRLHSITQNYV